jgi:hypothetical protein
LVVDAGVLGRVSGQFAADQRAAMGAAVDEGMDGAGRISVHDDRGVADIAGAEIAGIRDFGFEAEKIPGRAAKDPFLLRS